MFPIDQEEIQSLLRLKQNVLFFFFFFLRTANFRDSFSKLKEKILFFGNSVTGETENKQETVAISAQMTGCACNVCSKVVGEGL